MTINIIAAVAENLAIGYNNNLIYRISGDMKRFKNLTTGNTVIMGRKTFESLPKGALPNRRNIVLSTTQSEFPGCDVYKSLQEAITHCSSDENVFIMGGASVYKEALAIADHLYITEIAATPEKADVFFPEYKEGWIEESREEHQKDEKNEADFAFVNYIRK